MKSFGKIVAGISGVLLLLGIILVLVGYNFGGRLTDLPYGFRFGTFSLDWNSHPDRETAKQYYEEDLTNFNQSYHSVEKIKIDIGAAELEIKKGDNFSVQANDVVEKYFKSDVKNGVLTIEDEFDWSAFRFWGHGNNDLASKITVYIPEDFTAKDIDINLGAGTVTIEEISSKKVNLSVGAGELNARTVKSSESIELSVGAGEIEIDNLSATDMKANCNVGSININGKIIGKSDIECNIGEVVMNLDGDRNDYNYNIDCEVGSIIIDDSEYSFDKTEHLSHEDAIGEFDLECNVGNIELRFNEY